MNVIKRAKHDVYPYISAKARLAGAVKDKTIFITGGGKGIGRVSVRPKCLQSALTL